MLSQTLTKIDALLPIFFPHNCEGCGTDILTDKQLLCAKCLHQLPETGFFSLEANPVEKLFYGRLKVESAGAAFYFTKQSLLQHLLIRLKYQGDRDAGYFLGRMMGRYLLKSARFSGIDALVPLPLHSKKEFQRGYNQAAILCKGIYEVWHKPVIMDAIIRNRYTETQTHKSRSERWQNTHAVFSVTDMAKIAHKHLLLVDDVITTGASLEACGTSLLSVAGTSLSLATAAYTL